MTRRSNDTTRLRLEQLCDELSLEEKILVLTGRDLWTTWPLERIGLRSIVLSDGPSGVRGQVWDERSPSLSLPSATSLASTWDLGLAYEYGTALACEARRQGVDVVLGPTINIHRSPLAGRHFEAFSEDPLLTADLASAYVRGLQDHGVAAAPKHYIANDSESERFTVDVRVSERALREVYLAAFEQAIVDARAWLVMSSYNRINGTTATENDLLSTPLDTEWGFDGVVVSDWTAVRSLESARHPQDLVMPGPDGPWGDALVAAVRDGTIDEATIDRKVLRLLHLAVRVGALDGFDSPTTRPAPPHDFDGVEFVARVAAEGTVLVRNDGLLPLEPTSVSTVAVIGDHARHARTQGGGSATVLPEHVVSPLTGLTQAFADASVVHAKGVDVHAGLDALPLAQMTNAFTGEPGARVRLLAGDGTELYSADRLSSSIVFFGGDVPVADAATYEFATRWTPDVTGPILLGLASVGSAQIFIVSALVAEISAGPEDADFAATFLNPPTMTTVIDVEAGRSIDLRIALSPQRIAALSGVLGVTVGTRTTDVDADASIAAAVDLAGSSDVAIVVVGTTSRDESEGYDRSSLALPGRQDELVRAVAAANPRTIVVVNSGAPVELPWRDEVAAVLITYFGGQEAGIALGDVITGVREPGGRLPTTWGAELGDVPVSNTAPTGGVLSYDEGIHVGYRAWLRAEAVPAYEFGHGLGYTTWGVAAPTVVTDDGASTVAVMVTNTGGRSGKAVVQVYAKRVDSDIDRPERWLVGFGIARLDPGCSAVVEVEVSHRSLSHWDAGWHLEPGRYRLLVGSSVDQIAHEIDVNV